MPRLDEKTTRSTLLPTDLIMITSSAGKQYKRSVVGTVMNNNVSLTDGATVTWDFSQGNYAQVTLGGNRTLSITNLVPNTCGILKVIQDGTGGRTLSVTGSTPTGWGFSTGPSQFDVIGFIYDGTTLHWSIENYGTTLPSLSNPGSFTATVISTTAIDLDWGAVTNATGYILQRATNAGFTTGLTTLVNGTNVTDFSDTGLTASTTYYYRVKAVASGYNDSSFSTASGTTILVEFIDWDQLAQTTDAGSGTLTGNNTTEPAGATATKKMDLVDGNYVECTLSSTLSQSASCCLVITQNNDANYNNGSSGNSVITGVFFFGSNYFTYGSNTNVTTNSGIAPAASDVIRIRKSGNDAIIEKSTGGGGFTTIATKTGVFSGVTNCYIKAIFAVNTATARLNSCRGQGLISI